MTGGLGAKTYKGWADCHGGSAKPVRIRTELLFVLPLGFILSPLKRESCCFV